MKYQGIVRDRMNALEVSEMKEHRLEKGIHYLGGNKMNLKFNDGVTIDIGGHYRLVRKSDGLYVVGYGLCIPVEDREEAKWVMHDLNTTRH